MNTDSAIAFIKKNYFLICVGIGVIILLLFVSEVFVSSDGSQVKGKTDIETELERFLSSLQGVGECDVIIFVENEKTTAFSSVSTEKISGIAVVCSGGGNSSVKAGITEVLTRLFGISGSRISINEKK